MTTLPVCHYWIFSNVGLLIEDWLLSPPRPLDLTNSWRRTTLDSLTRSRPGETVPNETLQIVLYFAFPLLPILTIFVALVNIVHESKNYMCPRKPVASRPYITRLSHSLMVFFVLTLITSALTWTASLMRYIPMSPYAEQHPTVTRRSTNRVASIKNPNGSAMSLQGTHFVAQIPAILTMQAVLRLTLIWIILGLMIDRICVLNRMIQNPTGRRIQSYVRTIHEICDLSCSDELCPLHFFFAQSKYGPGKGDARTYSREGQTRSPSEKQSYFVEAAKGICVCFSETTVCNECLDPNCSHQPKQKRLCRCPYQKDSGKWRIRQKVKPADTGLVGPCSSRNRMFVSETTCSAGQTCMTTGFVICLALGMCLPQLWAYQLSRIDKDVENTVRQRKWITWQLTNRTGRALYEYGLAIVGFVLPGCLLLANVMLLVTKLWIFGKRLRRILISDQTVEEKRTRTAHERLAAYCVSGINRDSFIVLLLGFVYVVCWLPHATITTVHRLNCLINTDPNGVFNWLDRDAWPKQVGWLWVELIALLGDLSSQLVLLFTRLCEPVFEMPKRENQSRSYASNSPEEFGINEDNAECIPDESLDENNEIGHSNRNKLIVIPSVRSPVLSRPCEQPQISLQHHQQLSQQGRTLIPVLTASDDGQTSQNISPLPTSHTLSESIQPVQSRAGRNYQMIIRHLEARSCHSNPSPYPSPLAARIPNFRSHGEPASLQLQPTQMSYNEPRSSTVLLTYSPRSRHPCRVRPEPARCVHPPSPNSPNSQCTYWPSHPSPPPLPPPPRHLTSMIGADSSIYSTPHGSPNEQQFRSSSQNRTLNDHIQAVNHSGSEEEDETTAVGQEEVELNDVETDVSAVQGPQAIQYASNGLSKPRSHLAIGGFM